MFALLLEPLTWAIATGGAFIGSLVHDKVVGNPVTTTGPDVSKLLFYAGASLALIYGYKKVFK